MKTGLVILLLVGCTSDADFPKQSTDEAWAIHTHATCNGVRVDGELDVCVQPSSRDVALPGDTEAREWADIWRGACLAESGLIGTSKEGQQCLADDGVTAAPFGCEVNLVDVGLCAP